MSAESKPPVDLGKMLDERAERMVDAVEEKGDARAIAGVFRTLVEWSRSKPPQQIDLNNLGVTITPVAGNKE